jgi:valyl-tRNA synthetase
MSLTGFLEKSVAISSKRKGFYGLEIDNLVSNDEGLIQQKEKIEETLGNALILIKMMEAFNDTKKEAQKVFYIQEQKILEFLKTIIIGENVQGKILFDTCYIQGQQKQAKKNKEPFKEMIKIFGTDCTRMYAIDPSQEISEYEHFITKLRNASRYIGQHLYEKKSTRKVSNFDQLTNYLKKRKNTLSEFELRSIYKITDLQREYEEAITKNALDDIMQKILHTTTEDFCDKYLEIHKHQDSEN